MTFSARRHTPLYRLKIPAQRVGEVLTALAEGLDISAAVRVFGHCHPTITAWVHEPVSIAHCSTIAGSRTCTCPTFSWTNYGRACVAGRRHSGSGWRLTHSPKSSRASILERARRTRRIR